MSTRASIRLAGIAAALAFGLSLTGCFSEHPTDRIIRSAQTTLDDLDLRSGVSTFNTGEGFGSRYSLEICVEVADDVAGRAAAEQAVAIVNAIRDMTTREAEYLEDVQVRFVPESAGATDRDLDRWCRVQWPEDTIDLTGVVELFSSGSVRGPDYSVTVPYEVVAIVEEGAPAETPQPTETPSP